MKILWITLESILPANTGGKIGVFKRLEQMAKWNDIYLFYPYDQDEELEQVVELERYCKKVYPYSRKENKKHAILNIWKYPFTVASRDIPEMKKDIKKCIAQYNIDLINIDFPHMCVDILGIEPDIPIILNEHNIEWKVYRTIAKSHRNILKKVAYFIDSFRLYAYEKSLFKRLNFAQVTFVSSNDMEYMVEQKIVSQDKVTLIPVGADANNYNNIEHNGKNIIFVGKMSYGPNIEAVQWFVKDIFPKIKLKITDVKFYIVGKDPAEEVKLLQSENVTVTGMVPDVADYYNRADLVVLPLKNGGGVKIKLLEAVSYNKAIVSSSVGAEGTYFAHKLLPVTDDSKEFSEYCIDFLLNNKKYPYDEIYNYFIKNYTWEKVGIKYHMCMEKVMEKEGQIHS